MAYVIAVIDNHYHTEYIAEGRNYTVGGESFVPFTPKIQEAKRYKTYALAQKASLRSGENMYGTIKIKEVEDK